MCGGGGPHQIERSRGHHLLTKHRFSSLTVSQQLLMNNDCCAVCRIDTLLMSPNQLTAKQLFHSSLDWTKTLIVVGILTIS